jgi:1-acyl-sn-glycerol-3-phosphate acyltransferase
MGERRDPVAAFLHRGFRTMAGRGLRGIWLRGRLPTGPFVWAANHHSWWDPFVADIVLGAAGRPACLLMLQSNMERYGFARRLGVFGSAEPRRGLDYLADGRVLVIYPEGELRPPGRLGPVADGAAWYARRAGVPLCAVATRTLVRGHEAPEAYVSVIAVDGTGPVPDVTARLAETLAAGLSDMEELVATAPAREPLPGFRLVLRGRRSHDERIDALSGRLRWRS